jgi:hypothetical protein
VAFAPSRATAADPPKPPLALSPFLVLQGRVSSEVPTDLQSGGEPSVELRRLRAGLRLSTENDALRLFLHTNLTQAAPELVDAFIDHRIGPVKLRWGQAKIPFTGYRQEQFFLLPTADWAPVTRTFGAGRQLGVQVMKDPDKETGFYGAFGLFQGTQLRPGHDQGVAPAYGEPALSYTDFRRSLALDPIHPEAVLRIGRRIRSSPGLTADLEVSARSDARPQPARDFRHAAAIEGKVTAGPWMLRAITYGGLADRTQGPGEVSALGLLFQARHALGKKGPWLTAEYSHTAWSPELQRDARERAVRLVAEAPDKDRTALAKTYKAAGRSAGQWTALLALRQDIGAYTSLTAEAAWVAGLRREDEPGVLRLRLQAQVAF